MRYVFIINPISGKGTAAETIRPKIEEYFKDKDLEYKIYVTSYKREGVKFAREEAEKGDAVRIYACGGDGTMFDIVNGIAGHDNAEFGVIPGGSGNDFLRYFGEADHFTGIASLVEADSYPIDAIKVGDWYSVNVCSMGFDAEICQAKDKFVKKKFISGEMAYKLSCFYCLLYKMKNHFRVTIDDKEPIEGDYLFAIGANAKYYGSGFKAAPNAVANDGLLDCILLKTVSRFKFVKLLGTYRRGEHVKLTHITTELRAKKMTVECDTDATVNMDGEIITARKITFEILPKFIKFIVPKRCSEALGLTAEKETAVVG